MYTHSVIKQLLWPLICLPLKSLFQLKHCILFFRPNKTWCAGVCNLITFDNGPDINSQWVIVYLVMHSWNFLVNLFTHIQIQHEQFKMSAYAPPECVQVWMHFKTCHHNFFTFITCVTGTLLTTCLGTFLMN